MSLFKDPRLAPAAAAGLGLAMIGAVSFAYLSGRDHGRTRGDNVCLEEKEKAQKRADDLVAEENAGAIGSGERVISERDRLGAIIHRQRSRTREDPGSPIFDDADYERLRDAYLEIFQAMSAGRDRDGSKPADASADAPGIPGDEQG